MKSSLLSLVKRVRACAACEGKLELGPRPVVQIGSGARLVIIGQAPGRRVHETGIPWDDASGERLREWLQTSKAEFYNASRVAIIPMAFCYPGKAKSGDLPPSKSCAPLWHDRLLKCLPPERLHVLVGSYAQAYYLGDAAKPTMVETVRSWREYLPFYLPLPHPSPRNNIWLKKNSWFLEELEEIRVTVGEYLAP
ncbi:MAG: uracil-DNA glycosylase family protein [Bdellovibrionales bacterium]